MNHPFKFDSWLNHYYNEMLQEKDNLAQKGLDAHSIFKDISNNDLWTILLSKNYASYPNLKSKLPDFPEDDIQKIFNGGNGFALLNRARMSYEAINQSYKENGTKPLEESNILDFGVGWGRMLRFFIKNVKEDQLFGCDPAPYIVKTCEKLKVPGTIKLSDARPEKLPFDVKFDLVFSNSVFSHLSEESHMECLTAIHKSLNPGGMVFLTTWTPHYAEKNNLAAKNISGNEDYLFVPKPDNQNFGATFISYKYMQDNWTELFKVVGVNLQALGIKQVMVILQKK